MLFFAFVFFFSPLTTLASTPPDSEVTTHDSITWLAHASYFEIYEIEPPQDLATLANQIIEEENLPSTTPVHYHLVRYVTAIQEIEDDEVLKQFQDARASVCNINPEHCSSTTTYDTNGNLTNDGNWTQSWNYRNELTQSQKAGSTVTYAYDHTGQRVKMVNGSSTTKYANNLYNTDGTRTVKHIYAGDRVVATIEGTTLNYVHTDHLTGSNAVTNTSAATVQIMDYYPYGVMRIDWQGGTFDEQRKFTGHEMDRATNLTYANARYYKHTIGRFLSQDPLFLSLGTQNPIRLAALLSNPQALNSYAYANNNPLRYIDPTGQEAWNWNAVSQTWSGFANAFASNAAFGLGRVDSVNSNYQMGQVFGDAASLVVGSYEAAAGLVMTAGGAAGGIALSPTGVGAVAGAGATAAGMAMTAHGTSMAGTASYNLSRSLGSSKGSNKESAYSRAAEHAQKHYPNLSKQEIENLARQTETNADIKVNIKGQKTYYYNSRLTTCSLTIQRIPQFSNQMMAWII